VIVDADVTATHATNAVLSYERNTDNSYNIQIMGRVYKTQTRDNERQ